MTTRGGRRRSDDRKVRRPAAEFRRAYCPTCRHQLGMIVDRPGSKRLRPRHSYWDQDHEPKPFGIILTSRGRQKATEADPDLPLGTITPIGFFDPDDDPDNYHPAVKYHLLSAVAEWIRKGWMTEAEVLAAIAGDVAQRPAA